MFPKEFGRYIEIFGGSGAVLLGKEPSKFEVYNDIEGELVNFFRVVKNRPAELLLELDLLPLNSREEFASWLHFHDGGNEPTIHLPDQVEILDRTTPAYLLKEAEKLKAALRKRSDYRDVRQMGDYLYFCASRRNVNCPILRTRDPLDEEFEEVSAPFAFWDPDLFRDDDGRVYLYWGCTNTQPIWGIEMDPETMEPIGEKVPLIYGREEELGYERPGDNGVTDKESSINCQFRILFSPLHTLTFEVRV